MGALITVVESPGSPVGCTSLPPITLWGSQCVTRGRDSPLLLMSFWSVFALKSRGDHREDSIFIVNLGDTMGRIRYLLSISGIPWGGFDIYCQSRGYHGEDSIFIVNLGETMGRIRYLLSISGIPWGGFDIYCQSRGYHGEDIYCQSKGIGEKMWIVYYVQTTSNLTNGGCLNPRIYHVLNMCLKHSIRDSSLLLHDCNIPTQLIKKIVLH